MMDTLLARSLLAVFIVCIGVGIYYWGRRLILLRLRGQGKNVAEAGVPVILYFSSPDCAPCESMQKPALQRVKEWLGDRVRIVEIDTTRQPDLAKQWMVLSVPTTLILDAQGNPKSVNIGVTNEHKLLAQLSAVFKKSR